MTGRYILDPLTRCWRWVSVNTIHRWHRWAIGHPHWHAPRVLVENLPPVCLKAGLIVGGLLPMLPALPYGGGYGAPYGGMGGYGAPYAGAGYEAGAGGYPGGGFSAPAAPGSALAGFPGVLVPIGSSHQAAPALSEIAASTPGNMVVATPEPASWAVLVGALALLAAARLATVAEVSDGTKI